MIYSHQIHPMRFMRTRPFAKDAMRIVGRIEKGPTMAQVNAIAATMLPAYQAAIERLPIAERPENPTRMINEEMSLTAFVGVYSGAGRHVYYLGPQLVELLDNTDLTGVTIGDVKLPSPAFFISFGEAFDGGLPGAPNRIDGAYVMTPAEGTLQVVVTSRRLDAPPDSGRYWPLSRDRYFSIIMQDISPLEGFEAALTAAVNAEIKNKEKVFDLDPLAVANAGREMGLMVTDRSWDTAHEAIADLEQGFAQARRAVRLAINGLCYLNAVADEADRQYPADVSAGIVQDLGAAKKSKRQGAAKALRSQGSVVLALLQGRATNGQGRNALAEPADRTVRRHWRRGHWRQQAHGTGLALRRLTWIRPAIVGSADVESEDAPHRIYRAD